MSRPACTTSQADGADAFAAALTGVLRRRRRRDRDRRPCAGADRLLGRGAGPADRRVVELARAPRDRGPREALVGERPPGGAAAVALVGAGGGDRAQRVGQRRRVGTRTQPARLAVERPPRAARRPGRRRPGARSRRRAAARRSRSRAGRAGPRRRRRRTGARRRAASGEALAQQHALGQCGDRRRARASRPPSSAPATIARTAGTAASAVEQVADPLVGAQPAEQQHDRGVRGRARARRARPARRRRAGPCRQPAVLAVGDHDGARPDAGRQRVGVRLGMDDDATSPAGRSRPRERS